MNPALAFLLLFRASLFSTSGTGNLPILHDDYVSRGWATDRQFAEALAVGQISPGPSGLWVISMGYLTDGLRGSLLATVAIILPTFLIVLFERAYQRLSSYAAMEGFVRGLILSGMGVFALVLTQLLGGESFDGRAGAILLGAIVLGTRKRIPVIAILLIAALAGVFLYS